jgi:hypothetical protein
MPGCIGTITGSVMHFRGTSKMLATTLYVTIISGLIVHAVLVSGCMILIMFVMFWRSRSVATESV